MLCYTWRARSNNGNGRAQVEQRCVSAMAGFVIRKSRGTGCRWGHRTPARRQPSAFDHSRHSTFVGFFFFPADAVAPWIAFSGLPHR